MSTNRKPHQLQLIDPVPDYYGHRIRVLVDENGEPWFVAKDVCVALGLSPTHVWNHTAKLATGDVITNSVSVGVRPMRLVSEAGFYELVLGSRKPGAVAFKRWVCSEVLPAIRKTGRYEVQVNPETEEPVDLPDVMCELIKALPIEDQALDKRIHIWEWLRICGMENLGQQERAAIGRIARRILHTYDMPILSRWSVLYPQRHTWRDLRGGKVYPITVLEEAYKEFNEKGRKD